MIQIRILLSALLVPWLLVSIEGCSRVEFAYNQADFLLDRYADDYLDLTDDQLSRWGPHRDQVLTTHRSEELPYLAAFFDQVADAAEARFPAAETGCLVTQFQDLYQRQARLAAELAAPLLVGLDEGQIRRLKARFAEEQAEDRPSTDAGRREREARKRAKRWVKSIEDWTGDLSPAQRALVAERVRGFPDTEPGVYAYRTLKRDALIALLEGDADEVRLRGYLIEWLADYRDLPADLSAAGTDLGNQVAALLSALGATLTEEQRTRLVRRVRDLRDALLDLQAKPRLTPIGC